jgi:hypothetical protein
MISDLIIIIPTVPMMIYNSIHGQWMFSQLGKENEQDFMNQNLTIFYQRLQF